MASHESLVADHLTIETALLTNIARSDFLCPRNCIVLVLGFLLVFPLPQEQLCEFFATSLPLVLF